MSRPFDVVVLGGGIAGAMAVLHAASSGRRVLGIDASAPVRPSQGHARVLRMLGAGDAEALRAAEETSSFIRSLERATGRLLLRRTGVVFAGSPAALESTRREAEAAGADADLLSHRDIAQQCPHLRLRPGDEAVRDHLGGILFVNEIMTAAQALAQEHGAALLRGTKCERLDRSGKVLCVHTDTDTIHADEVVVALGAWTEAFLRGSAGLDLQHSVATVRSLVGMYQLPTAGRSHDHPPFVYHRGHRSVWGVADGDHTWKIGISGPHPSRSAGHDPGTGMGGEPDLPTVQSFQRTVDDAVVLRSASARHQWCFDAYTNNRSPLTGPHPADPRIHLLTGMSGRGFTLAPSVARAVTSALALT